MKFFFVLKGLVREVLQKQIGWIPKNLLSTAG